MPLYEYLCEKCGSKFELIEKFSDEPKTVHEGCGGSVQRLISAPALQFKGSGCTSRITPSRARLPRARKRRKPARPRNRRLLRIPPSPPSPRSRRHPRHRLPRPRQRRRRRRPPPRPRPPPLPTPAGRRPSAFRLTNVSFSHASGTQRYPNRPSAVPSGQTIEELQSGSSTAHIEVAARVCPLT